VPSKRSPLLASADRAACYFDRKRKAGERTGGGRWVSFFRCGSNIYTTEWPTEAEARAHIGLKGGSQDPAYRPSYGETGYEVSKG